MIFKNNKKILYNSRKKAILTDKRAPLYGPNKLVWVINSEGSTFLRIGQDCPFVGDMEIKDLMTQKIMPELNKNIGKLWIKDQEQTFKTQIFPTINKIIKGVLMLLVITFIMVLLTPQGEKAIYNEILITCILLIWIICVIMSLYTFNNKYNRIDYDHAIVKQIKQTLCEYNNLILKDRGYIAKTDQWGIWICVVGVGGDRWVNSQVCQSQIMN